MVVLSTVKYMTNVSRSRSRCSCTCSSTSNSTSSSDKKVQLEVCPEICLNRDSERVQGKVCVVEECKCVCGLELFTCIVGSSNSSN